MAVDSLAQSNTSTSKTVAPVVLLPILLLFLANKVRCTSCIFCKASITYQIERPFQKVIHDLFKIKTEIRLGENEGKLNVQIASQSNNREEFDVVRSDKVVTLQMTLDVTTFSEDIYWQHPEFHNLTGTIGLTAMQQDNSYKGRYLIPAYKAKKYGAYWIEKWKSNKWELQGEGRFDYKI